MNELKGSAHQHIEKSSIKSSHVDILQAMKSMCNSDDENLQKFVKAMSENISFAHKAHNVFKDSYQIHILGNNVVSELIKDLEDEMGIKI